MGDGTCDIKMNNIECLYDGGDCSYLHDSCPNPKFVGDGFCDHELNVIGCDYDGGDCVLNNHAHCYNRFWLGDNECDIYNNVTECGFDGGDCLGIKASESEYPKKKIDYSKI